MVDLNLRAVQMAAFVCSEIIDTNQGVNIRYIARHMVPNKKTIQLSENVGQISVGVMTEYNSTNIGLSSAVTMNIIMICRK